MTVYRKMTKMLLIMILLAAVAFPVNVFAATGDTISIDFDSSAKVELTVGQTPKQIKVYASLEGSSSKRDVTAASTWVSSNTNVVKVMNGLLTPQDAGTAMITATYNNAVATLEVSVTHPYKELTLERSSDGKYKLGDSKDTLQVKAKAIGGESATSVKDVSADADWSSSNAGVLTVDDGRIILVGEGTVTITAKYKGLTASFKAEVGLPYSAIVLKEKDEADVVKELELLVGDDPVELTAMTKATESSNEQPVTGLAEWSSSNESVATVKAGTITVLASGKTVIKASYLGVSKAVDVYVRSPYEAILLTPSDDQALFLGESLKVMAKMRNAANSTLNQSADATWTSDNQLAVTVAKDATASADAAATVTAKAVGSAVIKADNLGVSKMLKVTVYPTITDLTLEKTEQEMYTSDTLTLPKVSGTKLDGTKLDISPEIVWTSGNNEIAEIKDGKLAAVKAGTVTLTGKIKTGNVSLPASEVRAKSVELKVTVLNKVLILIGPEDGLGLVIGEEQPLPTVNAVLENGDELDVSGTIAWEVTGTNAVIKQIASGKVIKGLTKGTATLKGTYANKTISIPVSIEQKVVKLVVEPATLELNLKATKTIKVTGYFANGKSANFSGGMDWESSNPEVATVKGTSVKAAAEGTATLTGSYQGITATVKVTVVPKLAKLTVNETKLTLAAGSSQNVVVTALYDTGKTANVTGSVVWTSSKPSVAKVNASGTITAVSKGTTSIKGKWNNKTVTVSVTVK
ncbi:Ig-like domain-containing protein [Paenibacillus tianjinensis]|uniref:Ig-like domain-containing protein n=1 Tax=Paenibacillus tianjinensis TaxID=2810347 RepID=A0ABX7L753_9BACL|nr:Ig-like domain-containing protein [Paenibacillus tianjinensis]QSF43929.1 Ig-like domain-containing protein [Paenibacillus tianjinensis]